jgi:hypothetical protein
MDSTPVYTCGIKLVYSKFLARARIVGMTHSGASPLLSTLPGVFLALNGVFGVLRADAGADAVALRGVVGSRVVVLSGSALLR